MLAIDLGSTWCKAAYLDRDGGIVAEGRAYNRGGPPFGLDAAALTRTWEALCHAVRAAGKAAHDAGQIAVPDSLAISCRGVIGLWLDADGEAIGVPPETTVAAARDEIAAVYADPAWEPEDPYLFSYVPSLVGRTRWLRRHHPGQYDRVRRAGALHDWILYRLTGQWVTDPATGPGRSYWPDAVMTLTNLPEAAFPTIMDFSSLVGTLTPVAAADLGLPVTTRVVAGAHDGSAANLGTGAFRVGDACITLGTSFVLRVVTGTPVVGAFGYLVTPDAWAWVRGAHGLSAQLDAVTAMLDGRGFPVTPERHVTLTALAERASVGTPGLRLRALPLGQEARQAEAARVALRAGHAAGTIYRATLEGTALAVRGLLEQARNTGACPVRFIVTGGATANTLLLHILSGVIEAPLAIATGEAGMLGAAMCGAVGAGWYTTVQEAAAHMIPPPRPIAVRPDEMSAYATLVDEFNASP